MQPADEEDDESSTQHNSRQQSPSYDEDEEAEEQYGGAGSLQQLAKGLVRYALACEHSRIPIKRQDVNQKGAETTFDV